MMKKTLVSTFILAMLNLLLISSDRVKMKVLTIIKMNWWINLLTLMLTWVGNLKLFWVTLELFFLTNLNLKETIKSRKAKRTKSSITLCQMTYSIESQKSRRKSNLQRLEMLYQFSNRQQQFIITSRTSKQTL